jgi:hypothetical protein
LEIGIPKNTYVNPAFPGGCAVAGVLPLKTLLILAIDSANVCLYTIICGKRSPLISIYLSLPWF